MQVDFWDWVVVCFYFVFILVIGFVFRHISKNTSDYFRGGGNMLWWLAGVSAVISGIGSFVFVGGAAKIYKDGLLLPFYWSSTICVMPILYFVGKRFRRMRVITPMQAVKRRYGTFTEQFLTWLTLPTQIVYGALGLQMVAVFFAIVMQVNVITVIIVMGLITTLMSVMGGSWSVATSDFIHGIISFLVVIVIAFLTIRYVGGPADFIDKVPTRHYNFLETCRPAIVFLWIGFMILNRMFAHLNLPTEGARWLTIKDEKQASKMVTLLIFAAVTTPLLTAIAPMVSAIIFSPEQLAEMFPLLKNPEEAATVAIAFKVMPPGVLGLLLVGVFACEMTTMDTSLNRNSAIFIKNVYVYIWKKSSEKKQLFVGRITTFVLGLLVVFITICMESMRDMDLFDWAIKVGVLIGVPLTIPMAMGTVVKRTPFWAGWSTIMIGMLASITSGLMTMEKIPGWFTKLTGLNRPFTQYFSEWRGWTEPLTQREINDLNVVFYLALIMGVTSVWYFMTMLFYNKSSKKTHDQIEAFFTDLRTPIDHVSEGTPNQDMMQYRIIGILTMVYGGIILLGMLIPNGMTGRMCFLFVGGVITFIGLLLYSTYLRKKKQKSQV